MTNADVRRSMARIQQGRDARRAELEAAAGAPVAIFDGTRAAPAVGSRVFDPLTGEEGEVIHRGSETVVRSTTDR